MAGKYKFRDESEAWETSEITVITYAVFFKVNLTPNFFIKKKNIHEDQICLIFFKWQNEGFSRLSFFCRIIRGQFYKTFSSSTVNPFQPSQTYENRPEPTRVEHLV